MTQATVDNTPVSVQLNGSESVTVPTGETWVVAIGRSNGGTDIAINGMESDPATYAGKVVLTAGDKVAEYGSVNATIQGFKV